MAQDHCLTQNEIEAFVTALDKDGDGHISYYELEYRLDAVAQELHPEAKHYNLSHESQVKARHEFLRSLIGQRDSISAEEFKHVVASWNIPSLEQDKQAAKDEDDYMKKIPWARRIRAIWDVDGPEYLFLLFVVALQVAFGVWQCVKYATGREYQAALGWGVGLSRACAGALWPTLFFVLLSMSRWFSTWLRKSYYISRIVNWDLSQSFHVKISCVALALSTLHTIGHLSGSFVFGSRPDRQQAVAVLLGPDAIPKSYVSYIQSRPGWTGLVAIGLFYIITVLSIPWVRSRSYEIFQIGHLLMFPFIVMCMMHGTARLLQFPALGIILAGPTLLILAERLLRISSGIRKIPASLQIVDDETVCLTCTIPQSRFWRYKAGQYVFLQVPQISLFQWHPFTISTCIGREMQLHIKTDGDWTKKLRRVKGISFVGIDGPFGAPAQRFYDFDQSLVVGTGIGVTPFSGILNDLQTREDNYWNQVRNKSSKKDDTKDPVGNLAAVPHQATSSVTINDTTFDLDFYRRVDFHWTVRDKNHLLWFSDLLNKISSGPSEHNPDLDIRVYTYLTKRRKDISVHVYRWLLEKHRTREQPLSPLTGLIAPTHFGRPDFPTIITAHYDDMVQLLTNDPTRKRKVGVFFCGAPIIGHVLADLCRQMTIKGREDGSGLEYHFMIEVF
ncbi:hypothetical protein RBB50_006046 [Rhinocladiella similis]